MKRKFLLILISIIGLEIIGLSIIITINKKEQYDEKEVGSSENITQEDNETNSDDEVEKIRLGLKQAKLQIDQREQELKAIRQEILRKRNILLGKVNTSNVSTSNKNNTSTGNKNTNKNTNTTTNSTTVKEPEKDNGNKIYISRIVKGEKQEYNVASKVEDLGIPLMTKYPNNTKAHGIARNVWDMQTFKNRVYIGSGDYDSNAGPVDVYYYDIEKAEFVKEGTLQDEQINRFVIIDDNLIITGTDPKTGWDMGTYYEWKDNSWVTNKTLTGAIHNFDMIKYDGKLFAAIGNDNGDTVIMSDDGGKTFVHKYTLEENAIVPRIYDLFIHKGELYARGSGRWYKYDLESDSFKETFIIQDETGTKLSSFIGAGSAPGLGSYVPIKTKFEYNDTLMMINGSLRILNKDKFSKLQSFDTKTYVYDGLVLNGELYILCDTPTEDKHIISVYKTRRTDAIESWGTETEWELQMYFEYSDFMRSFEYANGAFYFGVGTALGSNDDGTNSGRILRVKI